MGNEMIEFKCGCGQKLRAKDEKAGQSFRCPKCQGMVAAPFPEKPQTDSFAFSETTKTNKSNSTPNAQFVGCIVTFLGFVICVGVCSGLAPQREQPRYNQPKVVETKASKRTSSKLTMEKYLQLKNGMSRESVEQILGTPGTELSSGHIDGAPGVMDSIDTVLYGWSNRDGSNLNVMFQNDRLVMKAQYGLD